MTSEFDILERMRGRRNGVDESVDALQGELDHLRICLSLAEEGTTYSRTKVEEMRVQIAKLETTIAGLRQKWS